LQQSEYKLQEREREIDRLKEELSEKNNIIEMVQDNERNKER
jgi:hypothetical protein